MKRKNSIKRDLNRRQLFQKFELKRIIYKSLIHDFKISEKDRYLYTQKLNQLPRNSSLVRIKNRCIITGRGHGILNFCGLSRIKFRDLAQQGLIMGWNKASW